MILIINICKEDLHYYEFVKPVEEIVKPKKFITKHYKKITKEDLKKAEKIIICGTSLKDNEFAKNPQKFNFLRSIKKPILGICGGIQLIGLVFSKNKLKKQTEIGFYKEEFKENFLGLKNPQEVYHLHNNYFPFKNDFKVFTKGKIPQAVKHKSKPIYGTLFHPEVRNKVLIKNFLSI